MEWYYLRKETGLYPSQTPKECLSINKCFYKVKWRLHPQPFAA
jgi:hypothetical protein